MGRPAVPHLLPARGREDKDGQRIVKPKDLLKEPLVLEFLGLEERHRYSESDPAAEFANTRVAARVAPRILADSATTDPLARDGVLTSRRVGHSWRNRHAPRIVARE